MSSQRGQYGGRGVIPNCPFPKNFICFIYKNLCHNARQLLLGYWFAESISNPALPVGEEGGQFGPGQIYPPPFSGQRAGRCYATPVHPLDDTYNWIL